MRTDHTRAAKLERCYMALPYLPVGFSGYQKALKKIDSDTERNGTDEDN